MATAPYTATVTGHELWGGGLTSWAVYKIEVASTSSSGDSWTVFRRFSSFMELHKSIKNVYGEEAVKELTDLLPDQEYMGSYLASFEVMVDYREPLLKRYLEKLTENPSVFQQVYFQKFLDYEGKGLSGPSRSMATSNILIQAHAKIKRENSIFEFWTTKYLVLTKGGLLYVLKTLYNTISESELTMDLNKGLYVSSNGGSIELRCQGHKVFIQILKMEDVAVWMRTFANFGTTNKSTAASAAAIISGAGTSVVKPGASKASAPPSAPTSSSSSSANGGGAATSSAAFTPATSATQPNGGTTSKVGVEDDAMFGF